MLHNNVCLLQKTVSSFPEKMVNWVSSPHYFWVLFADFCWEDEVKTYCSTSISLLNLSHAAVTLFFYMVLAPALFIWAMSWGLHYSLASKSTPLGLFRVFSGVFPVPIRTPKLTSSLQESLKEKSNNGHRSRAVKRQRWRVWPVLLWWSRGQVLTTRSSQLLLGTITTLSQGPPQCYWVCATISYNLNVKLNRNLMLQVCGK